MAKNKISEFSATAADNTDITNINIAEGCSPANVNNAIRSLMSVLKNQQDGSSGDPFTVAGTLVSSGQVDITGAFRLDGTAGASGQVLLSAGGSNTPTWSTLGTMAVQNSTTVAITGGTITGITDLTVADGGTGASSITANSVILGNGASTLSGNLVAPSTAGNVLTSNGTTWVSGTAGLGYNQTWQNVTRTAGVTYTNSTGKPICLFISSEATTAALGYVSVTFSNGVSVKILGLSYSTVGQQSSGSIIIPAGDTYIITNNMGGVSYTAQELR